MEKLYCDISYIYEIYNICLSCKQKTSYYIPDNIIVNLHPETIYIIV